MITTAIKVHNRLFCYPISPDLPSEIRHTAEQSDALSSYSYTRHDGRYFASQDIIDGKNNIKLTTSWLKSEDGADWSVRIEGEAIDCRSSMAGGEEANGPDMRASRASLIYHFGLEGLGGLSLDNEVDSDVRYGTLLHLLLI
jgi:mannosyl-oligosaccharide glucosidase